MNSVISIRALVSHPIGAPGAPMVSAAVYINCEACGFQQSFHVPGPHLRAVIAGLQDIVARYPELCEAHSVDLPMDTPINLPPTGGVN